MYVCTCGRLLGWLDVCMYPPPTLKPTEKYLLLTRALLDFLSISYKIPPKNFPARFARRIYWISLVFTIKYPQIFSARFARMRELVEVRGGGGPLPVGCMYDREHTFFPFPAG